jgi:chaperonin cofactor prefoldin
MFNTIEEAAEFVSGIVNQKVEANMKAIEQALDNLEEENEDDDVFYSFHQIQVVDD